MSGGKKRQQGKPIRDFKVQYQQPKIDGACRLCRREFGKYSMPDEAFKLAEDIQTLELVMDLLGKLDKATISDDRNESKQTIRRVCFILSAARNHAWDKLRHDFLSGSPLKPRPRRQTLAEIWELLQDGI